MDTYLDKAEMEMRANAIVARATSIKALIPADLLVSLRDRDWNWNPGGRGTDDHLALYNDIKAVGIKQPQLVSCRLKDKKALLAAIADLEKATAKTKGAKQKALLAKLCLCQGFLRATVIKLMKDNDPQDYANHFDGGVMCEVVFGLSKDQEYYLACDHDTVARSKAAVIWQAVTLRRRAVSLSTIVLSMWDEIRSVMGSITPKRKKAIAEAKTLKDKAKEMAESGRNFSQMVDAFAAMPDKVFYAWKNGEENLEGEKIKRGDLPDLKAAMGDAGRHKPPVEFEQAFALKASEFDKVETGLPKFMKAQDVEMLHKNLACEVLQAVVDNIRYNMGLDFMEIDVLINTFVTEGGIPDALLKEYRTKIADIRKQIAEHAAKQKAKGKKSA